MAGITGLQWATLGIASYAAIVSSLALSWQVIAYRRGGVRVRVRLICGLMEDSGYFSSWEPAKDPRPSWLSTRGTPTFAVIVHNTGRLRTEVTDVRFGSGELSNMGGVEHGPELPYELNVSAENMWFVKATDPFFFAIPSSTDDWGPLRRILSPDDEQIRFMVTLGNGTKYFTDSVSGRSILDYLEQLQTANEDRERQREVGE